MLNSSKIFVGVGDFQTSSEIRKNVNAVLDSGRLSYGPFISKFEHDFAYLHNCLFGIMSNSGTSALQVAIQTLKIHHNWQDGDEIIVPATTFVATSNVVIHNNLTPIFVDIEDKYYGINPDLIEKKITSRTRCIIPVHLFGMPCQLDQLMELAKKYDLKVIEDSCETMFADFNGKKVGSFGDIACFSTYIAHILITGVGGISITSNPDYAVTMRSLVNHGRDSIYISIDDDKGKTKDQLNEIIEKRFSFIHCGHSFRVTEIEGAIGLAQLKSWEENISQRQRNAQYLTEYLSKYSDKLQLPEIRPSSTHVFMMYPIMIKNELKQKICNHLEWFGVETRDMLPLLNQPFYKEYFKTPEKDYPVSYKILIQGFYIGCHPYMTPDMLNHICESFDRYFDTNRVQAKQTSVLVAISSSNIEVTKSIFSKIDLSVFDRVIIVDSFNCFNIGDPDDLIENNKVEIIRLDSKSILNIYQKSIEIINEDYIVFFQLDGSQSPDDILKLLSHIKLGYELVIASRFLPGGKRYDSDYVIPLRGFGNRFITFMLNLLFDANLVDSYQPFRAVTLRFLKEAGLNSKYLSNFQMSIKAVINNKKIFELPTQESKSVDSKSFFTALGLGLLTFPRLIREKINQYSIQRNKKK